MAIRDETVYGVKGKQVKDLANRITTIGKNALTASDVATVAMTGEYDDLHNEPQNFTDDDWSTLWS